MKKTLKILIYLSFIIYHLSFSIGSAEAEVAMMNSFSTGILRPELEARSDVKKYYSGVRVMDNMFPHPLGGAVKRPGTYYVTTLPLAGRFITPPRTIAGEYPTLQELTAGEIPTIPSAPSETAAVTAVNNATDLQNMTGAGKYYLTTNIDLVGGWTPITTTASGFVLDGRGFTISNMTISNASDFQGMFTTLAENSEIYDLTMDNCTVTADDRVGVLFGRVNVAGTIMLKDITIQNSTVTGDIGVGGMFGYIQNITSGDIYNCDIVDCNVTGNILVGGMSSSVEISSAATGDLNIVNCSVTGGQLTIDKADQGGGLVGQAYGHGTPTPDRYTYFHTSFATIDIVATGIGGTAQNIGGLVGNGNVLKFVTCYATGDITFTGDNGNTGFFGGLIGFEEGNSPTYTNSYATGNISLTGSSNFFLMGGLIGKCDQTSGQTLLRCYATGDITITQTAPSGTWTWYGIGGLVGGYLGASDAGGTIERCWATGDIHINDEENPTISVGRGGAGGLIGNVFNNNSLDPAGTILNCYAWGSVTTDNADDDSARSGFIGLTYSSSDTPTVVITNVYNAQTNTAAGSGLSDQIQSGTYSKGIIGFNDGTVTITDTNDAMFWDTDTSGILTDADATGHVTSWMQTQSNYEGAGWNFDTIWVLTETETTYDPVYTTASELENEPRRVIDYLSTADQGYVVVLGNELMSFIKGQ